MATWWEHAFTASIPTFEFLRAEISSQVCSDAGPGLLLSFSGIVDAYNFCAHPAPQVEHLTCVSRLRTVICYPGELSAVRRSC